MTTDSLPDCPTCAVGTERDGSIRGYYCRRCHGSWVRSDQEDDLSPLVAWWSTPCEPEPEPDPINQPAHYTSGAVEVIDAIEAWELGFRLGNAVKYIARAGKKDPAKVLEDLKKARWYLDREISKQGG